MNRNNIILASASPRRIEMMKQKGLEPQVMPAKIKEVLPFPMSMETAVMYLACKKALWVEHSLSTERKESAPVIIAADTVVYKHKIIGKPKNQQEAANILLMLEGDYHFVATGVCLLQACKPMRRVFYEVTKVYFKNYSEREVMAYVQTDEPYDKAGGYAIQGTFGKYVDHIEGDYENVIGFPWKSIENELHAMFAD